MKIEILLSTYNGERYLREMMDSLIGQDYSDFHITVRDDGSSDNTVDIIKEYQSLYQDKITYIKPECNLGYPDCFWYLLENCEEADMYAFCDQDDVWNSRKLSSCYEKCKDIYADKPLLYVHDYNLADGDLNVYGSHKLLDEGFDPKYPYNTVFYVMTQGFTMIINDKMRNRLLKDNVLGKNIPHDRWAFWAGFFEKGIIYDDRDLAIYRRHDASVTQTGKGTLDLIKDWWSEDVVGGRLAGWCKVSRYFARCYTNEMDSKTKRRWMLISGYNKGIVCYLMRLFFPMRLKPTIPGEIVLRLCFLLNKK